MKPVTLVSGAQNGGNVRLWDISKGTCTDQVSAGDTASISSAVIFPLTDETLMLASGHSSGNVMLNKKSTTSGSKQFTLAGFSSGENDGNVYLAPIDEKSLAYGQNIIGLIPLKTKSWITFDLETPYFPSDPYTPVTSLTALGQGELASTHTDEQLRVWNIPKKELTHTVGLAFATFFSGGLAGVKNTNYVIVTHSGSSSKTKDEPLDLTPQPQKTETPPAPPVVLDPSRQVFFHKTLKDEKLSSIQHFATDQKFLYLAKDDKTIKVYNFDTEKLQITLKCESLANIIRVFSENRFFTGHHSGIVKFWDSTSFDSLQTTSVFETPIEKLEIFGESLFVYSLAHSKIYDVSSHKFETRK